MRGTTLRRTWLSAVAALSTTGVALGLAVPVTPAGAGLGSAGARVLLVGTYRGHPGQYSSIQAAVDAARPGDWILVGPGDYHEADDRSTTPLKTSHGQFGGVVIRTPDLHLRGMNRNQVVVDGTRAGSSRCSSRPSAQDFGVVPSGGQALGRNGIVVYRAGGVSIENLTVCNFLTGSGDAGNEIWWNGGDGTGKIGMQGYLGRYLTATSTYFGGESTAAAYGIFSSNASRGRWANVYASNFNDSGMYVGACQQQCDMTIDHAWMEYNALGYSGTNSGGPFLVENSTFDKNQDGFDTNTQIGGDPPAPQDGSCPGGGVSPITHTHSCWVFEHNLLHNNNNPNVPSAGSASAGPTGTGMTVSGGRNDTVMDNVFSDNGAWGALFVPYPDSGQPSLGQTCSGTGGTEISGLGCVYDPEGDALLNNAFHNNGFFKNPKNVDYAQITIAGGQPSNCYAGNLAPDGSSPSNLEKTQPRCGVTTTGARAPAALLAQVLCDTGFGSCPPGSHYPQRTKVVMHHLPTLATMPDPCRGVPQNAWCPGG